MPNLKKQKIAYDKSREKLFDFFSLAILRGFSQPSHLPII